MIQDNRPSIEKFVHLGLGWIGDRGGGLERYQHGICAAHSALGHEVSAWVQSDVPINGRRDYDSVAYSTSTDSRAHRLKKLRQLAKSRFATPDFLMVTHHASVAGNITDLIRNIPHTVHFHGPWAAEAAVEGARWWKTALQYRIEAKTYRSADRLITLSNAFRDLLIQRYRVSPELVHIVPGAIDSASADPDITRTEARERLGWPKDRPIVLAIRRLVRRVGVDVLVDAVAQLVARSNEDSELLVLIGGSGPLKHELEEQIQTRGLENNVRLLGFIPDENLSTAYQAADLSIVPTQALEGFGLVTLESMAAGTPAMVTPVGSLPEVISDFEPSLVLPGKSATELAEGLRGFVRGELRLPSDESCKEYVRNKYDWSVIAPKVLDVYRQAAN